MFLFFLQKNEANVFFLLLFLAALDRAVIDRIEWAEIDRTEIDRMADRKEIVGQLGGSG